MPSAHTSYCSSVLSVYNIQFHENFDSCQLLHDVATLEVTKQENKTFRAKSKRTGTLTAAKAALLKEELEEEGNGSLTTTKAKELNMDHIYVKFTDFLWAYTFIGPFSYLLWKRRTIMVCCNSANSYKKLVSSILRLNVIMKLLLQPYAWNRHKRFTFMVRLRRTAI